MRLRALEDTMAGRLTATALAALKKDMVDFHGELVLLLHWSLVNYAGVAKILKKHDKLLGGSTQSTLLGTVLLQPFRLTDTLSRLTKQAETHVKELSQRDAGAPPAPGRRSGDATMPGATEGPIIKRTRAALGMLQQLQSTAHTPSTLFPVPEGSTEAADNEPAAKRPHTK
jgi:hypothetical protein